tara:strand:+ start:356 stop:622 length:267 start_codon:yes stop_codon:yes gene_type:complete
MSSEVHKYIEASLEEKEKMLYAEVINFPAENAENKVEKFQDKNLKQLKFWKLYDKSYSNENGDQLRTVVGICFMFSVLFLLGLYSSLI